VKIPRNVTTALREYNLFLPSKFQSVAVPFFPREAHRDLSRDADGVGVGILSGIFFA
jgi:hypothetical protein